MDKYTAQTKRYHKMILDYLGFTNKEKYQKILIKQKLVRRKQREEMEHKPMTNTMPPIEVGRNEVE